MKKKEIKEILERSKRFTLEILENKNPSCKCFTISLPLSIHLENNGISNLFTSGWFNHNHDQKPHYWLTLNNGSGFIIDSTIRQFNENEDFVFIGIQSEKYIKSTDEEIHPSLFDDVLDEWIKKTTYNNDKFNINQNEFLEINVKAAIFIHNELNEKGIDINNTPKLKYYFEGIFKIFYNNIGKIEKYKNLNGFDSLLLKYNSNC